MRSKEGEDLDILYEEKIENGSFITRRIYCRGENSGERIIDGWTGKETLIEIRSVRPVIVVNVVEESIEVIAPDSELVYEFTY